MTTTEPKFRFELHSIASKDSYGIIHRGLRDTILCGCCNTVVHVQFTPSGKRPAMTYTEMEAHDYKCPVCSG